jgi:hypothetical protein
MRGREKKKERATIEIVSINWQSNTQSHVIQFRFTCLQLGVKRVSTRTKASMNRSSRIECSWYEHHTDEWIHRDSWKSLVGVACDEYNVFERAFSFVDDEKKTPVRQTDERQMMPIVVSFSPHSFPFLHNMLVNCHSIPFITHRSISNSHSAYQIDSSCEHARKNWLVRPTFTTSTTSRKLKICTISSADNTSIRSEKNTVGRSNDEMRLFVHIL